MFIRIFKKRYGNPKTQLFYTDIKLGLYNKKIYRAKKREYITRGNKTIYFDKTKNLYVPIYIKKKKLILVLTLYARIKI